MRTLKQLNEDLKHYNEMYKRYKSEGRGWRWMEGVQYNIDNTHDAINALKKQQNKKG